MHGAPDPQVRPTRSLRLARSLLRAELDPRVPLPGSIEGCLLGRLNDNELQDAGARALAAALPSCPVLTTLEYRSSAK